jgi:hypothetical protein
MIDVAAAIDGEAVNVSLKREAEGQYDANGDWIAGTATTSSIRAAIQPASGRKLDDLPDGIRNEARWLVWSRSELRVNDEITHGGARYRVMHVWPRTDGGFWRAAAGLLA